MMMMIIMGKVCPQYFPFYNQAITRKKERETDEHTFILRLISKTDRD